MKKLLLYFWVMLFFQLTGISTSFSQSMVYVATKHVDKDFSNINAIEINAEKADIEVEVWDSPILKLSIEISAKHPVKSNAAKDIELLKYIAEQKNGVLYIKNYLLIGQKDDKPESNFITKYVLKIPSSSVLEIKNTFGKVNIAGKTEKLVLKTEFCNISLGQITGVTDIQTKYGEIIINSIAGELNLKSQRTDLNINDFSGSLKLDTYYGDIKLTKPRALNNLYMVAEKSTISLKMTSFKSHNIKLSSTSGKINLPVEFSYINPNKSTQVVENKSSENSKIKIHNKGGNITLEKL